jgi:hypothetical protein
MHIVDYAKPLRGIFRIRAKDADGNIIWQEEDHNLIVDGARTQMAHLIAGDTEGRNITQIKFGTNGDAAALGDTEITDPFTTDISSIEYPAFNQVQFNWEVARGENNGMGIMEFGLFCADGTLFARFVRDLPLNKDSSFSLEGDWTIEY